MRVTACCYTISLIFIALIIAIGACEGTTKNVSLDYATTNGSIDIVMGIDRCPKRWISNAVGVVDMTAKLKDVGATTFRTHGIDEDHSHPTNLEGIFPDWKNEWWSGGNDPFLNSANYNFDNAKYSTSVPGQNTYSYGFSSDGKIDNIYSNGFNALFRLGYRPNTDNKWARFVYEGFTYMPNPIPDTDSARDKVAIVCENIEKHYNEGWYNGKQYGIQFWEVWNEPDLKDMWGRDLSSTDYSNAISNKTLSPQFQKLYAAIATRFRGTRSNPIRPDVKIGPCALAWTLYPQNYHKTKSEQFCEELLSYCNSRDVPVDFYSWHEYGGLQATTDPGVTTVFYGGNAYTYLEAAKRVKTALQTYGYPNALSICDEWNSLCNGSNPYHDSYLAAAFTANVFMYMDYADVYMANYFPQANSWGLFDEYANYTKEAYAYKIFSQLRSATPNRLKINSGLIMDLNASTADNFAIMAGKSNDGNTVQILLADENQKYIKAPGYTEWLSSNGNYFTSNAISDTSRPSYNALSLVVNNLPINRKCRVTYRTIDANGTWVESPAKVYCTGSLNRRIILQRSWTPPAVCLVRIEASDPDKIGDLKNAPEGSEVCVTDSIVTATGFDTNTYFVESPDRSSGIKLITSQTLTVGQKVKFTGQISKIDGEYQVNNVSIIEKSNGTPIAPLALTSRSFGLTDSLDFTGLSTSGLLVRMAGKVTGKIDAENVFYLNDGSNFLNVVGLSAGIRVHLPTSVGLPTIGANKIITGISRIEKHTITDFITINGRQYYPGDIVYVPAVWVRDGNDIYSPA